MKGYILVERGRFMTEKLSAQWHNLHVELSVYNLLSVLIFCAFLAGVFIYLRDAIHLMRETTLRHERAMTVLQNSVNRNARLIALNLLNEKERELLIKSQTIRRELWAVFGEKDLEGPNDLLREQKPP